jgi:phosphoserine aminotransferase
MPPSMPFEKTELRNNKVSNTPEIMIWTLQKDVFKYQKRMSGKYPVSWFDIKDNFNKRLIGDYRKDIKKV